MTTIPASRQPTTQPATRCGWMRRPELDMLTRAWAWESPDGGLVHVSINEVPQVWTLTTGATVPTCPYVRLSILGVDQFD